MDKISLIIPCYNEELVVNETYNRLSEVMKMTGMGYELVFINDGSRDQTFTILYQLSQQDSAVKIINFSRNFGHQCAVTAGINNCNGDLAVIIDADLQDPPEVILDMLDIQRKEGANVVYGVRKKREGESKLIVLISKIVHPSSFVVGWTSIIFIIIFFGGIQLLTIGILGEYIGNLFDEAKDRPEYIIADKINL